MYFPFQCYIGNHKQCSGTWLVLLVQWQMAKLVECCGASGSMTVKGSEMHYINVPFLLLMLFLNTSLEPLPSPREELVCLVPRVSFYPGHLVVPAQLAQAGKPNIPRGQPGGSSKAGTMPCQQMQLPPRGCSESRAFCLCLYGFGVRIVLFHKSKPGTGSHPVYRFKSQKGTGKTGEETSPLP